LRKPLKMNLHCDQHFNQYWWGIIKLSQNVQFWKFNEEFHNPKVISSPSNSPGWTTGLSGQNLPHILESINISVKKSSRSDWGSLWCSWESHEPDQPISLQYFPFVISTNNRFWEILKTDAMMSLIQIWHRPIKLREIMIRPHAWDTLDSNRREMGGGLKLSDGVQNSVFLKKTQISGLWGSKQLNHYFFVQVSRHIFQEWYRHYNDIQTKWMHHNKWIIHIRINDKYW
jgi:hypothetical protein